MTLEEIKNKIKFFTNNRDDDFYTTSEQAKMLNEFIEWLSKDFVIVPKSHVRMAHKMEMQACESTDKTSACIFRQRALLIEALFGTELFNEEKG